MQKKSAFKWKEEKPSEDPCKEFDRYLSEKIENEDSDPLAYWKKYASHFPTLAKMAKDYLAIPATSVSSERMFSHAGNIVSETRASLSPHSVKALICLKSWNKLQL